MTRTRTRTSFNVVSTRVLTMAYNHVSGRHVLSWLRPNSGLLPSAFISRVAIVCRALRARQDERCEDQQEQAARDQRPGDVRRIALQTKAKSQTLLTISPSSLGDFLLRQLFSLSF